MGVGRCLSLRNYSGTKSWSIYDDRKRLTESYLIDKNGDTLISEQYKWQYDRLIKTIIDGVERVFVYGKTLQDTVKVIPSDEGLKKHHPGYNGTAGKIPDTNDPEYELFVMNPYGSLYFGYEKNEFLKTSSAKKKSSDLNILKKIATGGCVNEEIGMPDTYCLRLEKNDFLDNDRNQEQGRYGYPGNKDTLDYGYFYFQPHIDFEYRCNAFGKYQPYFDGYVKNEFIIIMQSTWKYNEGKWHERCWASTDLQSTYRHETKHFKNTIAALNRFTKSTPAITYDTIEKCGTQADDDRKVINYKWNEWDKAEREHDNPESPRYGGSRRDYSCN